VPLSSDSAYSKTKIAIAVALKSLDYKTLIPIKAALIM